MFDQHLSLAKKAALEAGRIIMDYFNSSFEVSEKSDSSVVTTADVEAEKVILSMIKNLFPGHSISAEESGDKNTESDFHWIVDPLDGTTNFSKKIAFFNTAIALEHKGEVVLAVVYNPVADELFHAVKRAGAFLNGKKVSVSNSDFESAFFTFCHSRGQQDKDKVAEAYAKLKPVARELRKLGSANLELASLACGRVDSFVGVGTKIWDFKPGCLIAEEAGAVVTDFEGNPWQQSKGYVFAASTQEIHSKLKEYF